MKNAIAMLFVSAALIAAPASTASAQTADHTLHERIDKRIETTSLKKYEVKVSVDSGVATLTGTVATEAERTRAGRLAMIQGIARVDNQLSVDTGAPDHTKGTMGTIESKTREGVSKTGDEITDGWITTRVHSKFVDEGLLKGQQHQRRHQRTRRDAARHGADGSRTGPRGRAGQGSRRRASCRRRAADRAEAVAPASGRDDVEGNEHAGTGVAVDGFHGDDEFAAGCRNQRQIDLELAVFRVRRDRQFGERCTGARQQVRRDRRIRRRAAVDGEPDEEPIGPDEFAAGERRRMRESHQTPHFRDVFRSQHEWRTDGQLGP